MTATKTVRGVALAPGVSRNGRLYTAETIERAVRRAQTRLADPDGLPIVMRTHHDAGDDTTHIVARVNSIDVDEQGRAVYEAQLADTQHARDIAALTEGPNPTVRTVSVYGQWLTPVRRERRDGQFVETADDLEIQAIDFTWKPGVLDARITTEAITTPATNVIRESYEAEIVMPDVDAPTYASFTIAAGAWSVTVTQSEDYDGDVDINADQMREAVQAAVDTLMNPSPAPGESTTDTTPVESTDTPQETVVSETTVPVAEATAPAPSVITLSPESITALAEALHTLAAPVTETVTTTETPTPTEDPAPADLAALRESLKAEVVAELVKEGAIKPTRKGAGLAETTEAPPNAAELWEQRGDAFAALLGNADAAARLEQSQA